MNDPHYVRFARALALLGTLGGPIGCGTATGPANDTGATPPDAAAADAARAIDSATPLADAGGDIDAFFDCTTCTCGLTAGDAGLPFCPGDRVVTCGCAAVGPLFPPDLPARA